MTKDSTNRINIYSLIISILAFGFGAFSTIKSCISEHKLENANYTISSLEYRPRLKISNPNVSKINIISDSLPMKKNNNPLDSIGDAYVELSFQISLNVTNVGNNVAKIIGYAFTDTISKEPCLKDFIYDLTRESKNDTNSLDIPILYKDLLPYDSIKIKLNYRPLNIANNRFIIHLILFYENELGQLFDTYYWVDYKINNIVVPNPIVFRENKKMMDKLNKEMLNIVAFKEDNSFSTVYSADKKNKLMNLNKKKN